MNYKEEITVKGLKIVNLKPVKKKFLNKNSKFSAKGYTKNFKVKIYEVFDKDQVKLRLSVSKNKKLSKYFPKLITYNNKYIVEKWVDGQTLSEKNPNKMELILLSRKLKKIIKIMWSIKYNKVVFDYINHIHKRIKKPIKFDLKNVPIKVNHNDLSLDNIIITSKGLKIIDNEFLGCSTGWLLNIKNSFLIEDFKYQNFISTKDLNNLWVTRKEWSKITNSKYYKKKNIFKIVKKKLKFFKTKISLEKILHNNLKFYNKSGYGGKRISEWPFYNFMKIWLHGDKDKAKNLWINWLVDEFYNFSLHKKDHGGMFMGSVHLFAVNSIKTNRNEYLLNPKLIKREYIIKGASNLVNKRFEMMSSVIKDGYKSNLSDPIVALKKDNMYILKSGHHRAAFLHMIDYKVLPDVIIYPKIFWEIKTWLTKLKRKIKK